MATKSRLLKTPTQLWVADNRKAKGLTPADLAQATGVTTDTARGWESRGRPSEDAIEVLERLFGVRAPRDDQAVTVTDLAAVVAAIDRLTAAVEAQTNANTAATAALAEGLLRALGRLDTTLGHTPDGRPDPRSAAAQ